MRQAKRWPNAAAAIAAVSVLALGAGSLIWDTALAKDGSSGPSALSAGSVTSIKGTAVQSGSFGRHTRNLLRLRAAWPSICATRFVVRLTKPLLHIASSARVVP